MSFVAYGFILPSLLLPFFILLWEHPFKIIRFFAKLFLIVALLVIIAVIPVYVFVQLKFWVLLVGVIPLMFRFLTVVLERLHFFSFTDKKLIENLMFASIGASSVIFIGASSNTLQNTAFLAVIIFLLYLTDSKIVEKYPHIGTLFGPIALAFPVFQNFNVNFTIVFVWAVLAVILEATLKLFRIEKTTRMQKVFLLLIAITAEIISTMGGVPLNWIDITLKGLTLFSITFIVFSCYILFDNLKNNYVRHYGSGVVALAVMATILILFFKYEGMRTFLQPLIFIFILQCLTTTFCRFIAPFNRSMSKSFVFQLDNVKEILELGFGKRLGHLMFMSLFGKNYDDIKVRYALLFLFLPVGIIALISLGFFSQSHFFDIVQVKSSVVAFITLQSMLAAVTFVTEMSQLSDKERMSDGLSSSEALRSSTLLVIEYFFMLIPMLLFHFDIFRNLGTGGIIFVVMYFLLLFINTNMFLYFDLKEKQYNNLNRVRLKTSMFMQLFGHSVLLIFFLGYYSQTYGLQFYDKFAPSIFTLTFWGIFMGKLIGYDTDIASKRFYKKNALMFVSLLLIFKSCFYIFPFVLHFIIKDVSKLTGVVVFFALCNVSFLARGLAVLLIPPSNDSTDSIRMTWLNMMEELKKKNAPVNPKKKKIRKV
ncbi:hypothetical protein [Paenibacillus sp. SI8]|uniref:hypothetical protein n=1 Tax=unclassified Paenibacillus TaxID=185978 RepID=UPI0034665960